MKSPTVLKDVRQGSCRLSKYRLALSWNNWLKSDLESNEKNCWMFSSFIDRQFSFSFKRQLSFS